VDILDLFDFPDVNEVNGARSVTTVPAQALYLTNSPFFQKQANLLADRVLKEVIGDEQRVQWLTQRVLGRDAQPSDQAEATQFLRAFADQVAQSGRPAAEASREAWVRFCQALLVSNEFLYLM
jgi:Protein of unknown function (DUF1553)